MSHKTMSLLERLRSEQVIQEDVCLGECLMPDGTTAPIRSGRITVRRNPDGPEAADHIEQLHARIALLEAERDALKVNCGREINRLIALAGSRVMLAEASRARAALSSGDQQMKEREVRVRQLPDRFDGKQWLTRPQPLIRLGEVGRWSMVRHADYPSGCPFVISTKEWDKLARASSLPKVGG